MNTNTRRTPGKCLTDLLIAALFALVAALPRFAEAQEGVHAPIPTPTLLMRIAQAVDGFRTGDTVYVVAQDELPHHVIGVFTDLGTARNSLMEGHSIFGPYATVRDLDITPLLALGIHLPTSECVPMFRREAELPICYMLASTFPFDQITSRLEIFHQDSLVGEFGFGPGEIDAIFFNLSAIDKFYMPYLTRIYGVAFASEYRERILERLQSLSGEVDVK